jgi:AcrR family transcriptional regulator
MKYTISPPRRDRAELTDGCDRTHMLLDAAAELLDEKGLEGLTIRAVLSRTGLARRAFYERFQGKDDLVLAVFESSLRVGARQFREMTAHCATPLEALEVIVTNLVIGQLGRSTGSGYRRSVALSREHLRLAEMRPAELHLALAPLLNLIAGHVEDGIRQGLCRETDPGVQAQLIYNLVSTTIHTLLLREEEGEVANRADREALADTVWEFCRRAIIA